MPDIDLVYDPDCPNAGEARANLRRALEKLHGPLVLALLVIALGLLAYGARRHGRWGPLVLGVVGSVAIVLARIVFQAPWSAFAGSGIILAASVWNAWPGSAAGAPCPSCRPGDPEGISTVYTKGATK